MTTPPMLIKRGFNQETKDNRQDIHPLETPKLNPFISSFFSREGRGKLNLCWKSPSLSYSKFKHTKPSREKESQQFEVDPDKAREALKNLDQQLQSGSQRQARPPRQKAPDVRFARDQTEDEEVQEFSGSFFTITAVAVFAFTIFYNVLFYTVIKPSIDGPEQAPTTIVPREIPK
ncbi:uncharacterized protein LOC110755230 [Prunus avium]|uniref:Uncharacterized protein LOC110755230 n=1 Tax=Prunus avium TaxID=42229 RepID=A0A6P5SCI1_PRUAV|nr:uncharacterized protein LOC110755230 [Prunus avium]